MWCKSPQRCKSLKNMSNISSWINPMISKESFQFFLQEFLNASIQLSFRNFTMNQTREFSFNSISNSSKCCSRVLPKFLSGSPQPISTRITKKKSWWVLSRILPLTISFGNCISNLQKSLHLSWNRAHFLA